MEFKIAYAYNKETGEFLGEVKAWLSPLPDKEGKRDFLLPANATFAKLPKPENGYVRVFNADTEKWSLVKAPDEVKEIDNPITPEQLASAARYKRNQLLAASDWTQLQDVPKNIVENGNNWREYRQALRDVPQQKSFPDNLLWPKIPTK